MKKVICLCLTLMLVLSIACVPAFAESGEHEHTWKVGKEATCGADGIKICETCGETEVIPATGNHSWTDGKAATCGADGNKICSVCGAVETVPATGNHNWTAGRAATCVTDGNQICSVCGAVEAVPATGEHTWQTGKAATCTEDGNKICTVCGAVETIDATGHSWSIVESTCVTEGSKTCTVCGESEILPLADHTEVAIPAKAATCTQSGLTEGTKCSVCGEILVAQRTVKATGHKDANNDGYCDVCRARISGGSGNEVPSTGDHFSAIPWIVIILVGTPVLFYRKKVTD